MSKKQHSILQWLTADVATRAGVKNFSAAAIVEVGLGETVEDKTGRQGTQADEKIREDVGGPTWTRTRDQPVMSRWL